jgi:hypothetical protein
LLLFPLVKNGIFVKKERWYKGEGVTYPST